MYISLSDKNLLHEVAAPELRASHRNLAILAVPNEYRAFDWTEDECCVYTVVYHYLIRVKRLTKQIQKNKDKAASLKKKISNLPKLLYP